MAYIPETKQTSAGSAAAPGWTTTEFWTNSLLIVGVIVLIALGRVSIDDAVKLWPLFASSGLYSLGRGLAKGRK